MLAGCELLGPYCNWMDALHKPASAKSISEVLKGATECTDILQTFLAMRGREGVTGTKFVEISHAEYLDTYDKSGAFKDQPLLEAYPEKAKEKVFLLPEFCCPLGVTDEMHQEKSPLSELLTQIKVSPQGSHKRVVSHGQDMENELPDTLDWVGFNEKEIHATEEGQFFQTTSLADVVLFILSILEIWLRSLRDVARVASGCWLEEPTKVCCSGQHGELQSKIIEYIIGGTQLMRLLLPNQDVRKVYHSFKYVACERIPVQRINAKFCGAVWQIIPKDSEDTFTDFRKRRGKVFSQSYSMAAELEKGSVQRWRTSLSVELQRLFRDALNAFVDCNDGILPETIVVYRASVNRRNGASCGCEALLAVVRRLEGEAAKFQKGTVVDDPGPTPEFVLLNLVPVNKSGAAKAVLRDGDDHQNSQECIRKLFEQP
ncbi:melA, partial [Symbiodinium sp. CCMP2592]